MIDFTLTQTYRELPEVGANNVVYLVLNDEMNSWFSSFYYWRWYYKRLSFSPTVESIIANYVSPGWWGTGTEHDPIFTARLAWPPGVSTFTNDMWYITSRGPETDPIFNAWLLTNPLDGFVPYIWAIDDCVLWEHSFITTNDWVVTRDVNGLVEQVDLSSWRSLVITRNVDNRIEEINDWVRTWTFVRGVDGRIASRTVT